MVGYQKKEALAMSFTMMAVPAALVLAVWGGVKAVSGVRQGNKLKIYSAVGVFVLLAAGAAVLMEFITRPL